MDLGIRVAFIFMKISWGGENLCGFLLSLYVEVEEKELALVPDQHDIFAYVVPFGTHESPIQDNA